MELNNGFFEETVKENLLKLTTFDFLNKRYLHGIEISVNELIVPFYKEPYRISLSGVTAPSGGAANPAISFLLLKYILKFPDIIDTQEEWITFREFNGAGPLTGHFTENTNKIIETSFAGKASLLKKASVKNGGTSYKEGTHYDVSMIFTALPGISVLLKFNDTDDQFPAQCSILFKKSAEAFLDLTALGIAGTYLIGKLVDRKSL